MFQMICDNNSRPLNSFPAHPPAAPLADISSHPRWQFKRMFQRRQTTLTTPNGFKPLREQPIDQFKSIQYSRCPHYSWGFCSTSHYFFKWPLTLAGAGGLPARYLVGLSPSFRLWRSGRGLLAMSKAVLSRLASEALNMSATRFLWRLDFPCPWTSSSFWHSILSLNAWERERERDQERERKRVEM